MAAAAAPSSISLLVGVGLPDSRPESCSALGGLFLVRGGGKFEFGAADDVDFPDFEFPDLEFPDFGPCTVDCDGEVGFALTTDEVEFGLPASSLLDEEFPGFEFPVFEFPDLGPCTENASLALGMGATCRRSSSSRPMLPPPPSSPCRQGCQLETLFHFFHLYRMAKHVVDLGLANVLVM